MSEPVKKTEEKQANGSHKLTEAGPGRPKGSKNKFTNLQQSYLDVFNKIENDGSRENSKIKTFFNWATKNDRNQGMFYQMISKMLPTNVNADGDLRVTINKIITDERPEE